MEKHKLTREFIRESVLRINENLPRIEKCLEQLSEEEVWLRPNPASNSIGNLILHLCGNITQYIISSLGEEEDHRERDREFTTASGYSKAELLDMLSDVVSRATGIIGSLSDEDLLKVRSVQGFRVSGIGNVIHVTEHYSYHTGQIAFYTKLLKEQDLGFYEGQDLNVKNV